MQHFTLINNTHIDPEFPSTLQSANLQNCPYLGDSTLHRLAQLPSLEALRWIANPAATPSGHLFLAQHTHLHSLNISGCSQFRDAACQLHLQNPLLHSLDVSFCPLTDTAFTSIRSPLIFLNLQGCSSITDCTLHRLIQIPTLKHLYLAFNSKITKVGLRALKNLPLHTLKIYNLDL